ncbi:MAG: c-type cytochrome [Rhodocyclaceae bacterium]|nr:c-type cytochrome [Rhodocyclaceae bacterium]
MRTFRVFVAAAALVLFHGSSTWASEQLLKSKNCLACHSIDKKLVGPAFNEVQRKYASNWTTAQRAALAQTIRTGGKNVWGPVPMPANPQVSEAEALQMIDWIMSLNGGSELQDPGAAPTPQVPANITPLKGLWWNPDQPGHGYDLQAAGNQLVMVWYTYDTTGRPVWYLAANDYAGNSWSADLLRTWNFGVDGETVGTVTLSFTSATEARFEWQVGGVSGQEAISLFKFGSGSDPVLGPLSRTTGINQTGLYFDPENIGYGLSIASQGHWCIEGGRSRASCENGVTGSEVSVLYFYDSNGNPLWALGSGTFTSSLASMQDMYLYRGSCPNCSYVSPGGTWVGTITRNHDDSGIGAFSCSIDSSLAGYSGRWERSASGFKRLTNTQEVRVEY